MSEEKNMPIQFKPELLPPPCGFVNIGATCYWNAFLQGLITCTTFAEILLQHQDEEKYKANPVAQMFVALFKEFETMKYKVVPASQGSTELLKEREETIAYNISLVNRVDKYAPDIWHCMNNLLRDRKKEYMRSGQQDSNEISMMLIDSLEELEEIQDLFMHQYLVSIYCHICNEMCSEKTWEYPFFDVDPRLKSAQLEKFAGWDKSPPIDGDLQSYLLKQNSYVDQDYRCEKCKVATARFKLTRLSKVPEILIVLSKNYNKDQVTNYVPELQFNMKGRPDKKLQYRAVAQIEHSGNTQGGHYWAYALRARCDFSRREGETVGETADSVENDNWWRLDDSSFTRTSQQLRPTVNTYMVFYNFMGVIDA